MRKENPKLEKSVLSEIHVSNECHIYLFFFFANNPELCFIK